MGEQPVRRLVSYLLAGSALLGVGASVFFVRPAESGPFGGTGQSGTPTIAAGSTTTDLAVIGAGLDATVQVAMTGALATDVVACSPLAGLELGLVVSYAFMADDMTAEIHIYNPSGAPIDPAANTWACVILRP